MADPRKKDTEKVAPDADALPEAAFNEDLSFNEGFGDLTPMTPEPAVHDSPIRVEEPLSEDNDASLDIQPDLDIEPSSAGFEDTAQAQQELPSEEEARQQKDALKQHEALVAAMTAKIGELTRALKQAQDEAQSTHQYARDLASQLQAAAPAGEITRLRGEVEIALTQRAMAEEELTLARSEREVASAEIARLNARLTSLESAATPHVSEAQENEEQKLRDALEEARGAISRVEHANEELARKLKDQEAKAADAKKIAEAAKKEADEKAAKAAQFGRELALLKNELAQMGDQAADVVRRGHELDDRQAELDRVTRALAEAQMTIAELKGSLEGAEARAGEADAKIKAAEEKMAAEKKRAADFERDAKEARERLDTEAARSFRLSQRRIPALQNEIAQEHAQNMELRRKIEKLEAEKRVVSDAQKEAAARAEELERALTAAKARMSDTEIIRANLTPTTSSLADEEIARLAAKVKSVEDERKRISESLAQIEESRKVEMRAYEERIARLNAQADERFELAAGLKKQVRALSTRLTQAMKLAALLAEAKSLEEKKPVLDKIAEVSKEASAAENGNGNGNGKSDTRVLAAEPSIATHPDDELKLERELSSMPELPEMKDE